MTNTNQAPGLIIYFSRAGENYFAGEIRPIEKGNTERLVERLAALLKLPTHRVETLEVYPENYQRCTEVAQSEREDGIFREVKTPLTQADVAEKEFLVFVGPCWWGRYPMALIGAIKDLDLTGKRLYVVNTQEGSGVQETVQEVKALFPTATFAGSLSVLGSDVENPALDKRLYSWAAALKLI